MTHHYERCGRYYGSGGWGSHGTASEEERRLTMMLFSGIFDSLAQRVSFDFEGVHLISDMSILFKYTNAYKIMLTYAPKAT